MARTKRSSIVFDSDRAQKDFATAVVAIALKLRKEFHDDVVHAMSTFQGAEDVEEGQLRVVGEIIYAEVVGGPWAAMDAFGTGSRLDPTNPAFEAYINSPFWNPLRDTRDTTIVGRPAGGYLNIFGEWVTSKGRRAGQSIERPDGMVEPREPSDAFREAARMMQNHHFRRELTRMMKEFPWGKYIVIKAV